MNEQALVEMLAEGRWEEVIQLSPNRNQAALRYLCAHLPHLLLHVPHDDLAKARAGAIYLEITGKSRLHRQFDHACLDDRWTIADLSHMLLAFGQTQSKWQEWQRLGIKKVQLLNGNDRCEACRSRNHKIYDLSKAPEIPLADCTCEGPCQCSLVVTDDE